MRSFLKKAVSAVLAALAAAMMMTALPALAVDGDEMFADPVREERAREIGRQLRCMVCQNQSIFDSNSGLAKDLRVLVRSRMDEGESDTEILTYIADRYGDYVLLKPRFTWRNAVLWVTPVLALLLGLVMAVVYLRARKSPQSEISLTDDEREAARKLLQEGRS